MNDEAGKEYSKVPSIAQLGLHHGQQQGLSLAPVDYMLEVHNLEREMEQGVLSIDDNDSRATSLSELRDSESGFSQMTADQPPVR